MKEVKTPKKPLAYYYGIVLIVLIVFNLVITPILMEHKVKETDYGTFMSMIEKKNIGEVEVNDNQIIFTDKDQKNIYKTGLKNGFPHWIAHKSSHCFFPFQKPSNFFLRHAPSVSSPYNFPVR